MVEKKILTYDFNLFPMKNLVRFNWFKTFEDEETLIIATTACYLPFP